MLKSTFGGTSLRNIVNINANIKQFKKMNSEFQMGHNENYWDLKESKGLGYILINRRFSRPY